MNRKWVDNEVYFGPDRRMRDASKRWGDRRTYNDAGDPPPLGAVLRRLRVRLSEEPSAAQRHHAMQLLNLAIIHAEKLRITACADVLRRAAPLITADHFEDADRLVVDAMAHVG
jgi:hypothetical protein